MAKKDQLCAIVLMKKTWIVKVLVKIIGCYGNQQHSQPPNGIVTLLTLDPERGIHFRDVS